MLSAVDAEAFDSLPSSGVLEAPAGWERIVGLAAVEQARAVRASSARIVAALRRRPELLPTTSHALASGALGLGGPPGAQAGPPAGLDRDIRLRDQTCRWPGCSVLARRCDLDHTIAYPEGPTNEDNLVHA
jgi:hypothetical protein